MENISKVFKALSDETRLNILVLASKRNICQKGISKFLGISDSAVSQHIKILKEAGILKGIKEGYFVFYSVDKEAFIKGDPIDIFIENENLNSINNIGCKSNCKSINKCCKKGGF